MSVMWWIQGLLTLLEITGVFIWTGFFFIWKDHKTERKVLTAAGAALIAALTVYQRGFAMYSRWYLLICCALCFLLCVYAYQGKKCALLLQVSLYFATVYSLDLFLAILAGLLKGREDSFSAQQLTLGAERILVYSLTRAIVAAVMIVVRRHKRKAEEFFSIVGNMLYLLPVIEYASLYACDKILSGTRDNIALRNWELFLLAYLFIAIQLFMYQAYVKKRDMVKLLELENEICVKCYRDNLEIWQEKERLYHDMEHHMLLLKGMAQSGDIARIREHIRELSGHLERGKSEKRTGRPLLDYVLQEKSEMAGRKGIRVSEEIDVVAGAMKTEVEEELCIMLGNLWDNAIEGSEKAEGEKTIHFSLKYRKNAVLIDMINSCSREVEKSGLKTTKQHPNRHGIGMRSIRYLVEKYQGVFEWHCEGGTFKVSITMYL